VIMVFSWNSTHTAIAAITAISISGMHYGIDLVSLAPVLAAIGAYAAAREAKRIQKA